LSKFDESAFASHLKVKLVSCKSLKGLASNDSSRINDLVAKSNPDCICINVGWFDIQSGATMNEITEWCSNITANILTNANIKANICFMEPIVCTKGLQRSDTSTNTSKFIEQFVSSYRQQSSPFSRRVFSYHSGKLPNLCTSSPNNTSLPTPNEYGEKRNWLRLRSSILKALRLQPPPDQRSQTNNTSYE
jgi:hypothetical protein